MNPRTFTALREAAASAPISIVVRGDCMQPHLRESETVEIRARRVYWPGDVIVFRTRAGGLAVHRVLGWRAAGVVTRGDHCADHDPPVGREAILGAVCMRVTVRDRVKALVRLAGIVVRRVLR